MRLLLLGATGAIGTPLSRMLVNEGHDVYVTSRNNEGEDSGIKYIKGNAHESNFILDILSQHWDAIIDFMDYSTQDFVCRYKLMLESTDHYLFFSSSRVYADSKTPITELSPRLLDVSNDKEYLLTDEYALHKAREENILFLSGYKNFTIIRPYITYSESRLQLGVLEKEQWAYRLFHNRTVLFSNDIKDHITTLTYANDVAFCISKLINNPKAYGEAFHIATDQYISWSDVMAIYQDTYESVTGKKFKVHFIDQELKLNGALSKYQVLYDRYYDRMFDNSKILNIVGNYSFTDIKNGLRTCFSSFIERQNFRAISIPEENQRNYYTGEHLCLGEIAGKKNKIKYLAKRILG